MLFTPPPAEHSNTTGQKHLRGLRWDAWETEFTYLRVPDTTAWALASAGSPSLHSPFLPHQQEALLSGNVPAARVCPRHQGQICNSCNWTTSQLFQTCLSNVFLHCALSNYEDRRRTYASVINFVLVITMTKNASGWGNTALRSQECFELQFIYTCVTSVKDDQWKTLMHKSVWH